MSEIDFDKVDDLLNEAMEKRGRGPLSISLPRHLRDEIKKLCREKDTTPSKLAELLFTLYLENQKKKKKKSSSRSAR